jgi:hypothetical protein
MREFKPLLAVSFLCALLAPAAAGAQGLPRLTVMVNGGYQPSTTSFDDSFTFSLYQETGRSEVSYPVDAGPIFEGGAAIRLWRGLAVGGVLSRFTIDNTVTATSFVPHPLFLQRSREVSGEAGGIRREENAVHIQAQYLLPAMGRFRIVLAGGPSVIDIKQSIVTEVNFTEEYPYDTATFTGVESRRVTGTATGFNAGADLQWMFTRNIGAGALVRVTRAVVDLTVDNRTIQVDAGGTQVGVGLRIGF